jgi:hypothetical protein
MTMPDIEKLARRAGIEKAWAQYPAEVENAIIAADRFRSLFHRPDDPSVNPPTGHPFLSRKSDPAR